MVGMEGARAPIKSLPAKLNCNFLSEFATLAPAKILQDSRISKRRNGNECLNRMWFRSIFATCHHSKEAHSRLNG